VPEQIPPLCAMHLRQEDVERLRRLAANEPALLAMARFHTALLMLGNVAKWLSAIIGILIMLKGFSNW
jgi:hypothetical protein